VLAVWRRQSRTHGSVIAMWRARWYEGETSGQRNVDEHWSIGADKVIKSIRGSGRVDGDGDRKWRMAL
jgi:hypothetical protein